MEKPTKENLIESGYHFYRKLNENELKEIKIADYYSTKSREFYNLYQAHMGKIHSQIVIYTGGICNIVVSEDNEIFIKG